MEDGKWKMENGKGEVLRGKEDGRA